MAAAGLQRSFNQSGIWCRQHRAQQGQPVMSQRREYGCGKRWRSGVTASYDRNTDVDEVQRSKELIMMGRKMRKAQCTSLYARDSNKKKRSQEASIDPGRTSLLDSKDLKVMSVDQERIHDG
jgi:hypothetical protein